MAASSLTRGESATSEVTGTRVAVCALGAWSMKYLDIMLVVHVANDSF